MLYVSAKCIFLPCLAFPYISLSPSPGAEQHGPMQHELPLHCWIKTPWTSSRHMHLGATPSHPTHPQAHTALPLLGQRWKVFLMKPSTCSIKNHLAFSFAYSTSVEKNCPAMLAQSLCIWRSLGTYLLFLMGNLSLAIWSEISQVGFLYSVV